MSCRYIVHSHDDYVAVCVCVCVCVCDYETFRIAPLMSKETILVWYKDPVRTPGRNVPLIRFLITGADIYGVGPKTGPQTHRHNPVKP